MKTVFFTTLTFTLAFSLFAQATPQRDALVLYRQGDFNGSVTITLEEIQATPENMDSYVVLGWSLLRLGRYKEAQDYAERATKIRRYDHRVLEILGEAHYYQGRLTEALKWFEEYANLAPQGDRISLVYYFMGEAYIQMGEFNHADIALSTAVYLAPNTAKWWERLGYARMQAKDYRYARIAYDQALRLNPDLTESVSARRKLEQLGGATPQ